MRKIFLEVDLVEPKVKFILAQSSPTYGFGRDLRKFIIAAVKCESRYEIYTCFAVKPLYPHS